MQRFSTAIYFSALIVLLQPAALPAQVFVGFSDNETTDSSLPVTHWSDLIRLPTTALETSVQDRNEYQAYVEALQQDSYVEAEDIAKRMVGTLLTRESLVATGDANGVAQSLVNLAIAQQLASDIPSAILNFEASIKHIEDQGDLLDQNLVLPLRGLASAHSAAQRPQTALRALDRALHVSNVNLGPHHAEQIPILDAMLRTQLEHGDLAGAGKILERIHTLALRAYPPGSEELLPTLYYKANTEAKLGRFLDERDTYRDIIKITSRNRGSDDFSLVEPYLKIARTYVYDANEVVHRSLPTAPTAEWYFGKAIAIAESHSDSDVETYKRSLLSLADYYTVIGVSGKADTLYRKTWQLLSIDSANHALRDKDLGGLKPLSQAHPHNFANFGYKSNIHKANQEDLLEGVVTIGYTISAEGTTKDVSVVAAEPAGFDDMELRVRQAAKTFIFRPRYWNGISTSVENQIYEHKYFYRLKDLPATPANLRTRSRPIPAKIN